MISSRLSTASSRIAMSGVEGRCGLLVPGLMVLASVLLVTNAQTTPSAPRFPGFPDLLHPTQQQRDKWTRLGQNIWDTLKKIDFDFFDDRGRIVPPSNGAKSRSPVVCGRVSRLWIRMPFHDCGTYSILTGEGGCNGSLRKELPSTMPVIGPDGKVIFEDVFDSLGADKNRADFAFDPQRFENTGMAASTSFYFQAKFDAEKFGLQTSWADVMTYAGFLALAMCDGPRVLFVPGREDANKADIAGALPAPTDNGFAIIQSFKRMNMMPLDGVVLQSSHTVACFATGCLDSTPSKFDNSWAKELLSGQPPLPECNLPGRFPQDAQPRCRAAMDLELLKRTDTRPMIELLAWNTLQSSRLERRVRAVMGPYGYGDGVLWKVNLCSPGVCNRKYWSYHHLFATSYFRLTSLGLPDDWIGWSYSAQTPLTIGSSGAKDETSQQLRDRITAWDAAYIFTGGWGNRG